MTDRRSVEFDLPNQRVIRIVGTPGVPDTVTSPRPLAGRGGAIAPVSIDTSFSVTASVGTIFGSGVGPYGSPITYVPGSDEVPLVVVRKRSDGTAIATRTDTGATIAGPSASPHQTVIQTAIRWVQTTAPGNVIELISDDGNEFTVNGTITTHDVGVSTAGTGGDGTFILQGGGGMPAAVPAMQGTSVTYGPFIRWTGGTSTDPILYMPDAHHCKVIRVGFHGNNQTTRLVKAGGQYVTFEGCWIGAPRTGGRCLWITGTTDTGYDAVAPQVRFCEIYGGGNNSWGIYIDDDTGGKEPTDGVITNTLVKGAEAGWVYSNSGGLIINGCHMTGNTDNVQGIVFNGGGPHIVVGCYLDTVKKGPVVQFNGGASLGKVVGNHFQNPKAAGFSEPHIEMGSGSWAIITNNTWGGAPGGDEVVPTYFVEWLGTPKGVVDHNVGNDAYIGSICDVTTSSSVYKYGSMNLAF